MTLSRGAGKIVFVMTCMALSTGLTYFAASRSPDMYQAHIDFQMASAQGQVKPDLEIEKKLLLSDKLLIQVLKDLDFLPRQEKSRFRSFDFDKAVPAQTIDNPQSELNEFKNRLAVTTYPENAVVSIAYKSASPEEARKIVETLYEKFRDWRQENNQPAFDRNAVVADENLAAQKQIFLQSQKNFLDFIEGQGTSQQSQKKAELTALIESLKLRYGPKHPAMMEAVKELKALEISSAPVPDQAKIDQLQKKMEADFKALDTAIKESVIVEQQKSQAPDSFQILPIGDVSVSLTPKFINYKMLTAALAALFLSLLYLKIRARIRPVFEKTADVQNILGVPCMGEIPGLVKGDLQEINLPLAETALAIRALRQELKMRGGPEGIKLITVTSTHTMEGRSELVASFGRIAARSGEKVLILDADLRTPCLQNKLPLKISRNLVDYLSGQARIEDIIGRTDPSGLHVIYGTAVPNTALDLISSDKMKTLLHSLREVYDLVLVQVPCAPKGPDARVLAGLSDQTLYMVEAGKTLRSEVQTSIKAFEESKIGQLAAILVK